MFLAILIIIVFPTLKYEARQKLSWLNLRLWRYEDQPQPKDPIKDISDTTLASPESFAWFLDVSWPRKSYKNQHRLFKSP